MAELSNARQVDDARLESMSILERIARRLARWKARRGEPLSAADAEHLGRYPDFDLVFADDSRQESPTRPGMRPVIAVGGISVQAQRARALAAELDEECAFFGFPPTEEFKWSPGRSLWMRTNLVEERRTEFFVRVLARLTAHEVRATVVIVDGAASSATQAASAEEDAVRLFLERMEHLCTEHDTQCIVIADRPGGGRAEENAFLAQCLEMLVSGTKYVLPRRIAHNVVSTHSHLSRLLQAADLVTGITLARVAGEKVFAPPLFEFVRPMLYRDADRIGGFGLKIHPALRYLNLYHWLCGDTHFWRMGMGHPMPLAGYLYLKDEWTA